MRWSSNYTGQAYGLTVFAPIVSGREEEVRRIIESVPLGQESPLARLDQLHMSRLQIIDRLVYQGPPQKADRLRSSYLVFTGSFDGALDPFLDALAERLPVEADSWWRHCIAYPGTADRVAFKRWIRKNQIHTSLFVAAYRDATLADVRESLALRDKILEFAIAAQGLEAEELQERFRRTFGEAV